MGGCAYLGAIPDGGEATQGPSPGRESAAVSTSGGGVAWMLGSGGGVTWLPPEVASASPGGASRISREANMVDTSIPAS